MESLRLDEAKTAAASDAQVQISLLTQERDTLQQELGTSKEAVDQAQEESLLLAQERDGAHKCTAAVRGNVVQAVGAMATVPPREDDVVQVADTFINTTRWAAADPHLPQLWSITAWLGDDRIVAGGRFGSLPEMILELTVQTDFAGRLTALQGITAALMRPALRVSEDLLDALCQSVVPLCESDQHFVIKFAIAQIMVALTDRFNLEDGTFFCESLKASHCELERLIFTICVDGSLGAIRELYSEFYNDGASIVGTRADPFILVLWHRERELLCVSRSNIVYCPLEGLGVLRFGERAVRLETAEHRRIASRNFVDRIQLNCFRASLSHGTYL